MCFILQEQFRAYRNQDGSKRKQKALPMMVLRKSLELSSSERDLAVSWLMIGAIFFAMRSCEYLKTAAEEKKRTKIIRIGNVSFKKQNRTLNWSDDNLDKADLVRIRFVFQKNDRRDVCVHMFRSGDNVLCPVVAWANIVNRVRLISGASENSEVCLFQSKTEKPSLIHSSQVRTRLRAIVDIIGEEELGFNKDDIGLHSIRSGGAMAMFLSGISVIIIQRVGRWSSEAFLEYIRDQVESFTMGVSNKMLQYEEFFSLDQRKDDSIKEPITDERLNENGVDSVPFRVQFSKLALESRKETE
jgi:hypothetical protein